MNGTNSSGTSNLMSFHLSAAFLTFNILAFISMCYFSWLIIEMVKRENKKRQENVLNRIILCYALIMPVIISFFIVTVNVLFSFMHPVSEMIGDWYCYVFKLLAHFGVLYIGILSLVTSIVRYCNIRNTAVLTSKEKANRKRLFLIIHCSIAMMISLLNFFTSGIRDGTYWVDRCWNIGENNRKTDENGNNMEEFMKEKICYNNEYSIEKHLGVRAAEIIEPILRSICGGVRIFYLMYMTNVIEIFVYMNIFRHINRSYHRRNSNFPCIDENLQRARIRRRRINKILIVLDFLTEGICNLCQMIVYLIPSDDPRIQYFSFSLWVFLYSCPIPMSYLLNEKRVKEVIIKDGWIEGIKSGFHTSRKIRQQEILSLQKRDINSESLRKNGEIDKTECVKELLHVNRNDFDLNCYNNTDEQANENVGECYHDMSASYDTTSNNEEHVIKEIFVSQDKKKRQELDVTRTKSFKSFSRQYILQKLLHALHNESDDSKYVIYKNYLLKVETISDELCNESISNDLIAALENAYHLYTDSIGNEILNASHIRSFTSERQICSSNNTLMQSTIRRDIQIVKSMIASVAKDDVYHEYMSKLYNLDEEIINVVQT